MPIARPGTTVGLFAAALSLTAAAASRAGDPPPAPPPAAASRPAPVHVDAADLEKAMLDADRAFLYGDGRGARAALDRAEKDCRRLAPDEQPAWPRPMIEQDGGMHLALDRAREYASRAEIEDAIGSMVWVMRCCRNCHALRDKRPGGDAPEAPAPGSR